MEILKEAAKWISGHTNKVTEFLRQLVYALMLFHVLDWTPDQQIAALMAISAFLAMFTESGTVSKQRVGERIDEEVERRSTNGTGGTGTFRAPMLMLLLALIPIAGCTKSGPILVRSEDAIHDSLLRVKAAGDRLCSEQSPILSVETCKTFYTALTPTLEAGAAFNLALQNQQFDKLVDLVSKVTSLMEVVRKIPQQHRGAMEFNLKTALRLAASH